MAGIALILYVTHPRDAVHEHPTTSQSPERESSATHVIPPLEDATDENDLVAPENVPDHAANERERASASAADVVRFADASVTLRVVSRQDESPVLGVSV